VRRHIPVAYGMKLKPCVNKVCAEYLNLLPENVTNKGNRKWVVLSDSAVYMCSRSFWLLLIVVPKYMGNILCSVLYLDLSSLLPEMEICYSFWIFHSEGVLLYTSAGCVRTKMKPFRIH